MITPAEINRRNREYYGQEVDPPTPATYERRFVAFIDILGWKDACFDPKQYAAVFAVAEALSKLPRAFSQNTKDLITTRVAVVDPSHQKTEVVTFSDSLVISTLDEVELTLFFKFLTFVCRDLITHGFLTRGGVTVGKLYHKENVVFGPALIDAVTLEKKAIHPVLLCSRDLVAQIECSQRCEPSDQQVAIIDHLGRSIVNLLAFEQDSPAAWPDLEKKITEKIEKYKGPSFFSLLCERSSHKKRLAKWRYMRDLLQIMIQGSSKR